MVVVYVLIISFVPQFLNPYSILLLDIIAVLVSLLCMSILLLYTDNLPEGQRTCIHGLIKIVIWCYGLHLFKASITNFLVNFCSKWISAAFVDHTEILCFFVNPRNTLIPVLISFTLLLTTKLVFILFPTWFLNLNHDRAVQCGILITFMITMLDQVLTLALNHLETCDIINLTCVYKETFNIKLENLENMKDIKRNHIATLLVILIVLVEVASRLVLRYKNRVKNRLIARHNQDQVTRVVHGNNSVQTISSRIDQSLSIDEGLTLNVPQPLQEEQELKIIQQPFLSTNKTMAIQMPINAEHDPPMYLQTKRKQEASSSCSLKPFEGRPGPPNRGTNNYTVLLLFVHLLFATLCPYQFPDMPLVKSMVKVGHLAVMRIEAYSILLIWITNSDDITAFAWAKIKNWTFKALSSKFLPTFINKIVINQQ